MGKFMARNKLPFPRNKIINHGNGLPPSVWWSILQYPDQILLSNTYRCPGNKSPCITRPQIAHTPIAMIPGSHPGLGI